MISPGSNVMTFEWKETRKSGGNVILETGIAAAVSAEIMAVEPDDAVAEDTVKFEK